MFRVFVHGVSLKRFERLGDAIRPGGAILKRIMRRVATLMVGRTKKAFEEQGRQGETWDERQSPNVAGILHDLERSAADPPTRRFAARPAGLDTGKLRQSIFSEVGDSYVLYGSRYDYANSFQMGGEREIPITDRMRENLKTLLKRYRHRAKAVKEQKVVEYDKAVVKVMREAKKAGTMPKRVKGAPRAATAMHGPAAMVAKLGFLFSRDSYTFKQKARPFVRFLDEDETAIDEIILSEVRRAAAPKTTT